MNKQSLILKASIFVILFGMIFPHTGFSQNIDDEVYYNRLFYTCKVWGHVKYYHTQVAKGNVNWDAALLDAISGIKKAPDNKSFNDSLLLMINRAGEMEVSSDTLPEIIDSLNNNSNYSWMQNSIFSESVKEPLEIIKNRFRPHNNVYLSKKHVISFDRDTLYCSDSDYPSEGKRVLALFRYWNIIHYFFPYRNIMDQNWDTTLAEFIPLVLEATDALSYSLAIRKLTTRINDSHAFFYSPSYSEAIGTYYPPFSAGIVEDEVVIKYAVPEITKLKAGDIITELDGYDIDELRDSLRVYAHGSNAPFTEKRVVNMLWRGKEGDFEITVDNGTSIHTETLERKPFESYFPQTSVDTPAWKDTIIGGNSHIGIAHLWRLLPEQVGDMFSDLWDTDAIIFDARYNSVGTIINLVNYLFERPLHIATFMIADRTYPGRLYWYSGQRIGQGTQNPYPGKLIILFGATTQSHGEYTCMGLEQFPGAIKIGSTTAASDGNISPIYLPGNISTQATFLGVFYPDGTPTQRVGIIPDIEVHQTIAGVRAGKDEVMEFALNYYTQSIEENIETPGLTIFPNPALEYFNYQLGGFENLGSITIQVLNIWGKVVKQIKTYSTQGRVNVSDLSAGNYLVKVETNNKVFIEKVVIQ